jgi:hypothetical protein
VTRWIQAEKEDGCEWAEFSGMSRRLREQAQKSVGSPNSPNWNVIKMERNANLRAKSDRSGAPRKTRSKISEMKSGNFFSLYLVKQLPVTKL